MIWRAGIPPWTANRLGHEVDLVSCEAMLEKAVEQGEEKLFVQYAQDVTLVTLQDERIVEETCIKGLEKALMAVVEDAKRQNLLLDFSNVRFMSSAFLGLLVRIHKRVGEKGGYLKLKNIDPDIHKVFEITHLTKVFDIS